jgi:hypothetical protein
MYQPTRAHKQIGQHPHPNDIIHGGSMHVFNTSEHSQLAINLYTESNATAKICANLTKSKYMTYNDKAKLPSNVNDQLAHPVNKKKHPPTRWFLWVAKTTKKHRLTCNQNL